METLTESEREARLAEVQVQRGEPGCVAGKAVHGESARPSKHVSPPLANHTLLCHIRLILREEDRATRVR